MWRLGRASVRAWARAYSGPVGAAGDGAAATAANAWDRGGKTTANSLSPLQDKIRKLVNDNPACVSLVQVGSFYELYFHQAEVYGPRLGLKVALRNTTNFEVPMAGFPVYQLEKYVKMLVHDWGESVAIVDQSRAPGQQDGVVHRRVLRIVTPGTLVDESFMNWSRNNYLLAIALPPEVAAAPAMDAKASAAAAGADKGDANAKASAAATKSEASGAEGSQGATIPIGAAETAAAAAAYTVDPAATSSAVEEGARAATSSAEEGTECTAAASGAGAAGAAAAAASAALDPSLEVGLAWLDVSLGEFHLQQSTLGQLLSDVARIAPSEIILSKSLEGLRSPLLQSLNRFFVRFQPARHADLMLNLAVAHFRLPRTTDAYRVIDAMSRRQQTAAHMALSYVAINLPEYTPVFEPPRHHHSREVLQMDARTRDALELTARSTLATGTLLSTVKRTVTDSGARTLRQWIGAPVMDLAELRRRHDCVEAMQSTALRQRLRQLLACTDDFVRAAQRLLLGAGDPVQQLMSIASAMVVASDVRRLLEAELPPRYAHLKGVLDEVPTNLAEEILDTFEGGEARQANEAEEELEDEVEGEVEGEESHEPSSYDASIERYRRKTPALPASAALPSPGSSAPFSVRPTYNQTLADAHREHTRLWQHQRHVLERLTATLQRHDRRLRVVAKLTHGKHTDVLQLRAPEAVLAMVAPLLDGVRERRKTTVIVQPEEWRRAKDDLNRQEACILAEEERIVLQLRRRAVARLDEIRRVGRSLDYLDVTASFLVLAHEHRLVRPRFVSGARLEVDEGRHLVVEASMKQLGQQFVPNDTRLAPRGQRLWVVTGPNMGGKSTFLRQNALIVILAQMGCFVPARRCTMGLVDRIFSRIGASDDILRDMSTFMVEMAETSAILNHATPRSLAVVDELGRGTSGREGLAIAYGALVALLTANRCRTMFATHYGRELQLLLSADGVDQKHIGYYMTGIAATAAFVLDHRLTAGISARLYAFEVARMAGFPPHALQVAQRAYEKMQ